MKKTILFLLAISIAITLSAQPPKFMRGMNFDDNKYKTTLMKAPLVRSMYGQSLPASASLKKWAPTPDTQGNFGTCVGWSSAYCARTIIEAQRNNWSDKQIITQNVFSPGYLYKIIKNPDDASCIQGSYIDDALRTMRDFGIVKLSDFNNSCATDLPSNLANIASQYKIKDYAKLFDIGDGNNMKIERVKKSLSENKPVVIGMKCPDSFYDAKDYWMPIEDPNGSFGGHAMCVIGYDDNVHGGCFEIQNSWGTWWGNDGYIWIPYETFANFTKYAFELIDNVGKTATNEIDLSGTVRFVLSNGSEMKADLNGNTYKMQDAYKSGTRFRIYISNNEPAFVYAIGSDLTNETYLVFPYSPTISAALNYKQNDVALPDEDHYIEMDEKEGTDYLCVLYSNKPLSISTIQSQIERTSGTFKQKVESVLNSDLVSESNIEFLTDTEIGFKAKSNGKSVVVLLIETQHIK